MQTSYEDVLGRDGLSLALDRGLVKARPAQAELGALVLVAGVFLGCTWLSWRRLGSLIVDGGHELDVPRRLVEGAALYRDFSWNWGPLAPWVNAGLYRLFGVHSDTLMWAGLISAALACLGLYLVTRRFVGPFTSAWVAIAFLAVSAFAQRIPVAIFNFVAPYNFSATYGITLAIWSVFLLLHHARSGRPGTLVASAVLAGLVALTKLETTFAVVVAHGAFLVTVLPRPSRTRVLAWGGGLAVAAVGYLVAARLSDGYVWRSLVELFNGGSRFYITRSMGVREVGFSLREILLSVIGWVVLLLAARWLAEKPDAPRDRRLVTLVWIVMFVVPAFIVTEKVFRAAPFLLAAGIVWIAVARRREGDAALGGRWREHLVVWVFALGAIPRILLRTGVDGYGFYLLPPTLACVAIGMTCYLAAGRGPPRSRRILAIAASTVLAGVALDGFRVNWRNLTRSTSEVKTARVWRLVDPASPEATLIPYLTRLPASTVCAAVPDGAGLIFAAGLTPPEDGMIAYIPMHLHGPETEQAVLEAWERKPPQVIVHWGKDQSDVFGYAGFGRDYGVELGKWISQRYEVAKEFPGWTTLLVPRDRR
jgi:4-amino-4-deoxy-L-arabinose transferase-like glycosyltransferase